MTDPRQAQANALLGELHRQSAGRLTLFLGAAPGVGKTYAMLQRAAELQRGGLAPVVGIVETHGRAETAALLAGLEIQPRRQIEYQGRVLEEMDLDALLARHPALVLVDELAHRNVPGSRHERRWQDVVELLDAGIDVHATINIQHLESLNDVVFRITGVRVAETVPDSVFDRLRDVVLVDLPPGQLIERLQQGKVYVPEQAAAALQAFFTLPNLAALRELAMQTAADRVDLGLRETQAARGLPGTSLRQRVLVAVDGMGQSDYLVRVARRIAERRDAPWSVVTVQTARTTDVRQQDELDKAFALARRLGGDAVVLHGDNIVDALLDHAARSGTSTIIVGRTRERRVARMFNRTLTQQLLQRGAHYVLTIVSTPEARARARRSFHAPVPALSLREAGLAVAATAIASALGVAADRWVALDELSPIFMVAVLVVAARTRVAAAALAAVLCFFAYNFFFIEPRYTLLIGATQGFATVLLFLAAALVAGRLAARLRMQVLALRAANTQATALQALGRQLTAATDVAQVLAAGRSALKQAFEGDALVQLAEGAAGTGPPAATVAGATDGTTNGADAAPALDERDRAAADWSRRHRQPAGRFSDTLSNARWSFLPLPGGEGDALGVIGLRLTEASRFGAAQRRLAEAMAEDIGQSVVRTRLVSQLEGARVTHETERLRSALLSSVSHDLRSPLAAIIGAASTLDSYADALGADDRHALLDTVRVEGERLDRYIQNLLDMTRLGHGELSLNRDWIGVDELVGSVVSRLQRYQPGATVELDLATDLAPIWVHPALVEQALFNVVENAASFSPPGVPVRIAVRRLPSGALQLDVTDEGPGIPEDERQRIFDMFYTVERGDTGRADGDGRARRGRKGTGLGLAISQGMVGAHGGSVDALAGPGGRGTTIRITLPHMDPPAPRTA